MSAELERLATVLTRFADDEVRRTSPLYETLARAAANDPELLALLLAAPPQQRTGTLFLAGVHYLVLGGAGGDLAAFFPDVTEHPASRDLDAALRTFCLDHANELREIYATRNTQTNEVARTSYLLPMVGLVSADAGRPLALIEPGASAGLNLLMDRFFYDYGVAGSVGDPSSTLRFAPTVRTAPPVPRAMPAIASRAGVDLQPVDVRNDDAVAWLRACIWPEHAARREQLARAVEIARADPPTIHTGDAVDVIPELIAQAPEDAAVCVFHTSVLAYLSAEQRDSLAAGIHAAGARRPVYWVAAEGPRALEALFPEAGVKRVPGGYALVVERVGGPSSWAGRAGYHGDWIEWSDRPIRLS